MAVAALVVACFAALLALLTFVAMLLLLGGKEDRFVTWRHVSVLIQRMDKLAKSQSDLFRYLEGVDEQTGGRGHQMLKTWVPGRDT